MSTEVETRDVQSGNEQVILFKPARYHSAHAEHLVLGVKAKINITFNPYVNYSTFLTQSRSQGCRQFGGQGL